MSGTTATLTLITNVDGDSARTIITTDESANMAAIDALFHATTGHLHTGAGTNGPKISGASLQAATVPAAALAAEVGAWTSFTPTADQGAGLALTVQHARWAKIGKLAFLKLTLTVTSAGTAGQAIRISDIPAVIAPAYTGLPNGACGTFMYYDSGGAPNTYVGIACLVNATCIQLYTSGVMNTGLGVAPAITAANGDVVTVSLVYETTA